MSGSHIRISDLENVWINNLLVLFAKEHLSVQNKFYYFICLEIGTQNADYHFSKYNKKENNASVYLDSTQYKRKTNKELIALKHICIIVAIGFSLI